MKKTLSFAQFRLDIWLLEQLRNAPNPGLTLSELQERWSQIPNANCKLSRDALTNHRKSIREFIGIRIEAPDRLHYRIVNPESLFLNSLANDSLPLHHSQKEQIFARPDGVYFDYYLSPSDDFLSEIARW